MKLEIISATILIRKDNVDKIILKTNLPCPFIKEALPSQPNLTIDFQATEGVGVEYVRKNFNIEPEVIKI